MMTPKLEELIWCGEAEWRTWTVGTGNPVLQVGENETIIVTDIWYYPFIDSRFNALTPATVWQAKANHQVTLASLTKRYNFLTRAYFVENQGIQASFEHFDVYAVFPGENLNLFIATIPSTDQPWVITPGTAPANIGAKTRPLGYGAINDAGLQGVNRINFGAGLNEVRPHYPTVAAPATDNFDDFQVAFKPATVIVPPLGATAQTGNYQYPLITIGYVKINKKLTGQLK